MQAFLVDPTSDPKVELIAQLLTQLGYAVSRVDSIGALKDAPELSVAGDHLVVVPDTAAATMSFSEVSQLATRLKGSAFLVYITSSIQPDQYKALIRTGAADWVAWESAL